MAAMRLNLRLNSFFQKPTSRKVSYREIGTLVSETDYANAERFAELDHCVARRHWNNSVIDVETDTKTTFPSDHFPLLIKYRRKLKIPENREEFQSWKGAKLVGDNREEAREKYDNDIVKAISEEPIDGLDLEGRLVRLHKAMFDAAEDNFVRRAQVKREFGLTSNTKAMFEIR